MLALAPSIPAGATTRRFLGHSKDVLSVAFSADNRQIVSGSRDKTIKLWNTLGERAGVLCEWELLCCVGMLGGGRWHGWWTPLGINSSAPAVLATQPERPHCPVPSRFTLAGECKYTIGEPDGHTEWVSCVRFSPVTQASLWGIDVLRPAALGGFAGGLGRLHAPPLALWASWNASQFLHLANPCG